MKFSIKTLGLAGVMALVGGGASALTLDFTSYATFGLTPGTSPAASTSYSGTFGGVGYTLSSVGGNLTYGARNPTSGGCLADSNAAGNQLTCNFDGVGVSPEDEANAETNQAIQLKFDRIVTLEGVHILDAFFGEGGDPGEAADVYDYAIYLGQVAATPGNTQSGYSYKTFSAQVQSLTFYPSGIFDDENTDFALAAVDLQSSDGQTLDTVPLPAGGVLLLGALGGLGLMRRRRKAA